MGAACSRRNNVTQIINTRTVKSNSYDEDELFMNFCRPKPYHTAPTNTSGQEVDRESVDLSSVSSLEMLLSTQNVKMENNANTDNKGIPRKILTSKKRESKDLSLTVKDVPATVIRDTVTKEIAAKTIKAATSLTKESSIDISKKVGEILDKLIPPESPTQSTTRVGRQSRLMHADLNTVVSYDVTGKEVSLRKKASKQRIRKGMPTLINVKPFTGDEGTSVSTNGPGNNVSPESPSQFHVCKHGIPLADGLDDGGGCVKCQRPGSRGGRQLQGFLRLRRAERSKKRKKWAKSSDSQSHKDSKVMVDKALQQFVDAQSCENRIECSTTMS